MFFIFFCPLTTFPPDNLRRFSSVILFSGRILDLIGAMEVIFFILVVIFLIIGQNMLENTKIDNSALCLLFFSL